MIKNQYKYKIVLFIRTGVCKLKDIYEFGDRYFEENKARHYKFLRKVN